MYSVGKNPKNTKMATLITNPVVNNTADLMDQLNKCRDAERLSEVALCSFLFGGTKYTSEMHMTLCDVLTAARKATIAKERELAAAVFKFK
jgi:hypothetical protein